MRRILLIANLAVVISTTTSISLAQQSAGSYFHQNASSEGSNVLFIRKEPVIVALIGFDDEYEKLIEERIVLYALASNLKAKASGQGANFVLIKDVNVISNGSPNSDTLRKHQLPEKMISTLTAMSNWDSGCGVYIFKKSNGRISISVGLVDASLEEEKAKICLSDIIARSYGIGLGTRRNLALNANQYRNAYLLSVTSECDTEFSAAGIERVTECLEMRYAPFDLDQK